MKKNKILISLISILCIYSIIGFVAIPKLIKPQIEKTLNSYLNQKTTIEKIEFNPFLLKFSLYNFKIKNKKETTISIEKLYIDFAVLRSLDERHLDFKDLNIVNPYINIIEYEDGSLNLEKLVKETKEEPTNKQTTKDEEVIKFQIYRTILDNAKIKFTKLSKDQEPFKVDIDKLNYTFYDMGTYRNSLASHNFRTLINKNTELIIKGGLRLTPFKMYGNISLKNFRPSQYLAYKKHLLNFDINKDAFLDLRLGYKVDTKDALKIEINNADLKLHNLNLTQDSKPILSLANLELDKLNLNYPKNKISLESIFLNKLDTNINFDKNNKLNLTNLIKKENNKPQIQEENENSKPWKLSLEKFDLEDSNIKYTDLKKSVFIDIKSINLNLNKFLLDKEDYKIASVKLFKPNISIKDKLNKVNISNKELELKINNIETKDESINFEKLNLKNSNFTFIDEKNLMDINALGSDILLSSFMLKKENINLNKLNIEIPKLIFKENKNLLKVDTSKLILQGQNLKVNGSDIEIKEIKTKANKLNFDDLKNKLNILAKDTSINLKDSSYIKEKLKVANLKIDKPVITMKDNKNKQTIIAKNINLSINKILQEKNNLEIENSNINKPNLSIILEKNENKKEEEKNNKKNSIKKENEKNNFNFNIGPVKINDMKMSFQDKNLPISFKTNVTKLNGEFSRFNSNNSKPTKLKLEGKVDKYGYTKITGIVDINDIKLLTNTNLLFKNIAIKNFTPYSGKFIGRKIESGKLNLDLKYNIKKSDLNAKNSIIISDIKLGDKVESKDAVNLPLELAIALLEDSNGIINIDLPIEGNVDDPKFSIAPIVWKAFVNLLTKAISSPFSLLGSLLGIDAKDIKTIEFEFGKSTILSSEQEALDNIAKILEKKPKLAIKISPFYDSQNDKKALQKEKLEKILKTKMKEDSKKDEYKKALENLYLKLKKVESLAKIQKRYTNKNKEGKEIFDTEAYVKELKDILTSKQEVTKEELISLTKQRISTIKKYLFTEKKVSKKSIIIEKIADEKASNKKWLKFKLGVTNK